LTVPVDEVVALALEWGPERMRPFGERVRERWPDATDDEIAEGERMAGALLSRACQDRDADLAAEFPLLSSSTIAAAAWQGQYSRWRDGEEP
jgi:hypothetical protein